MMEQQGLRPRIHGDLPLSDNVIAEVLHRLPPRWLAVSRCVCKTWCRAIDERHLLRTDLLPLSLTGMFLQFEFRGFPEYFSCSSSMAATFSGKLDFLPPSTEISDDDFDFGEEYFVDDHCNGLLLVNNYYVVNPATRCWDSLASHLPLTDPMGITHHALHSYLAFDPTVSPHYHVFKIPYLPRKPYKLGHRDYQSPRDDIDPMVEKSEWPPSTCILNVFSSRLGCWAERSFAREGNGSGVVAELRGNIKCGSTYWRRALYVHWHNNFVMRISLSDDKYSVIKPPVHLETNVYTYLGRSKNGVYFASFIKDVLRVWILEESYGQMKWMLNGQYDLKPVRLFAHEGFKQSSDNGDVVDNRDVVEERQYGCNILVFHPYEDIIFLSSFEEEGWTATVHAYHLSTSRVECLGNIYSTEDDDYEGHITQEQPWQACFPYTPCWIGEFPRNK